MFYRNKLRKIFNFEVIKVFNERRNREIHITEIVRNFQFFFFNYATEKLILEH